MLDVSSMLQTYCCSYIRNSDGYIFQTEEKA